MKNNLKLLIGLAIPIAVLLGLTVQQQFFFVSGHDYTFDIEGYDPRDLLSGNYIRFKIKYQSVNKCYEPDSPAHMCVRPLQYLMGSKVEPACEEWITGKCTNGTFEDDINRFYIPLENAPAIEKEVLAGHAQVVLSVGKGHYVVKDLLINGKSWKEMP